MIKILNLSKFYGDVKAVKSINFELNDGEVVGFLGARMIEDYKAKKIVRASHFYRKEGYQ